MTKANTRRRPRQVKKVRMLLALSWSNERIAHALRISKPTLRKRFGDLIADKRGGAADTLEARFYELLWQQVEAGNASAMKLWMQLQQQRDIAAGRIPAPFREKLGKKGAASAAALVAHEGTEWQSLLKH